MYNVEAGKMSSSSRIKSCISNIYYNGYNLYQNAKISRDDLYINVSASVYRFKIRGGF